MQRKIVRAVEWIGQALCDTNRASAFIKAMAGMEALFGRKNTTVISPGILASLSEACAHLLGQSPQKATEIEKKMKHLYQARSQIVHHGSSDVDPIELHQILHYAILSVKKLLMHPDYCSLQTIDQLYELQLNRKYAWIQSPPPTAE